VREGERERESARESGREREENVVLLHALQAAQRADGRALQSR